MATQSSGLFTENPVLRIRFVGSDSAHRTRIKHIATRYGYVLAPSDDGDVVDASTPDCRLDDGLLSRVGRTTPVTLSAHQAEFLSGGHADPLEAFRILSEQGYFLIVITEKYLLLPRRNELQAVPIFLGMSPSAAAEALAHFTVVLAIMCAMGHSLEQSAEFALAAADICPSRPLERRWFYGAIKRARRHAVPALALVSSLLVAFAFGLALPEIYSL